MPEKKTAPAPSGFKYKPQWGVVVICDSERNQSAAYKRLLKSGLKLKVVTV